MNGEVSLWMRGLSETEDEPPIPFLATRGYDSVVWNRLYSRDTSNLEDNQLEQASIRSIVFISCHGCIVLGVNSERMDEFYGMIIAIKLGCSRELNILRM